MTTIARELHGGEARWVVTGEEGTSRECPPLAELLALPLTAARAAVEQAAASGAPVPDDGVTLAPVDRQEVWAAGVTYERSRDGRAEESAHALMYDLVYEAPRPELFLKSTPERVVGPGDAVGIRADSGWDVPEPELGLVLSSSGEIFGYVVGNDMSSRSIEGENPLYLPQAKVYTAACALGPVIVPVWDAGEGPFDISLRIERDGGAAFEGTTSTAQLHRTLPDLASWLFRALDFPYGAVLLTGTGLVPEAGFTLAAGDVVEIAIDGVGRLTNPVAVVGTA
ncbi:fumarylacetoacetate (FAA) hydrolase [Beutenbergia cavernae DSM 12333]|uniref:Fumarylacetoacetate (FAA) hydrolase n=1 Tax=Beutenbergia cavernae (strain ATCC BAA-8 / DSM 12333 / CCUG 43141 / JCM 11478 / NBRC 16432 / NCIMB 13614 / HKI 0122) TaxID=471853 RepID=C5BWC0_BEUC1|nr:fumarylacetoacetate hydrolase family protein [Beutenbergia cavernae]ACQ78578.1 fumarylacetoacetate (FAA) hydrolase [Beutenbergia cavernae DSM 12333]